MVTNPGGDVSVHWDNTRGRNETATDIESISSRLRANASKVKLYGDNESDAEWPATEPIPSEVVDAVSAVSDAVHALDVAIAQARLGYRKRVLQWLLAETLSGQVPTEEPQ